MAEKIDVPFTNTSVDASADGAKDSAKLAAGFSVLAVAGVVGVTVANRLMEGATSAAGIENPNDGGFNVEF